MAILQVKGVYKVFGGETLLKDISFNINHGEKIGLIGQNGAGKTTLIKMILGSEEIDPNPLNNALGDISRASNLTIGYLSQNFQLNEENTIFSELMENFSNLVEDYKKIQELTKELAVDLQRYDEIMEEMSPLMERYEREEGYSLEYKVKQVLTGLNLKEEMWSEKIENLSGGQKSRVALGKLLLKKPDLLILDEPTNHLDLPAINWLEKFLKEYNGAFIVISHDRYFLDSVVDHILDLELKTIKRYKGNYSDYLILKEAYLSGAIKSFEKEQEKIKKTEEFIRRYKAGVKSKQARGREKILNRMEKLDDPIAKIRKMKLKFEIDKMTTDKVVFVEGLEKTYDRDTIFKDVDIKVYRGEKIGLIGRNGVGKSTILKIINGNLSKTSGSVTFGERVDIGYYDQNHDNINPSNTIYEELVENYPLSEEEARRVAGGFLFTEEEIFKKIEKLSGGEKARVSLMKILLDRPNFLIFDEPTNHLDIYSREVLSEALEGYEGTLIVVSHDRRFLEDTVTKIYEIKKEGAVLFQGDYESYIKEKEKPKVVEEKNVDYNEQKKLRNRKKSIENKIEKIDEKIDKLGDKREKIMAEFDEAGRKNDISLLGELQEKLDENDEKSMELLEEQEELVEELSEIEKEIVD